MEETNLLGPIRTGLHGMLDIDFNLYDLFWREIQKY